MKILTYVYLLFLYIGNLFSQTIIPGGNVSGTWTTAGSPYHVTGNITVPSGQTLSIDPGVIVKFDSALGMTVNGILLANGNETDSILFTRYTTALWRSLQITIGLKNIIDDLFHQNHLTYF